MALQKHTKRLCFFFTSSHVLDDALLYFLPCIAYNYVTTQMPLYLLCARKPGRPLSPWWPRRRQGVAASVINWIEFARSFTPSSNGRTLDIWISTPPLLVFTIVAMWRNFYWCIIIWIFGYQFHHSFVPSSNACQFHWLYNNLEQYDVISISCYIFI
jgi:hypothetical protein